MAITRRIPTIVTALALTAAGGAVPVASLAAGETPAADAQKREVCAKSAYVKKAPGVIPVGTVFRGEQVRITRRSASGRYVHIVAVRPRFTVKGWIDATYLCKQGQRAEFAKTSRYSVRIVNSLAGGDPGFLYVGGPANITIRDAERAGQRLTLCVTPAPEQRPSCRSGRTGRTIDTIVWSQAAPTEVRITIDGGPVLVDTVRPYAVPGPGNR
ncbi:MAG TPA: hypothetical protein VNA28_11740 [Solirubrobacteraceae bacterium]|nr:hypothetical protein [Solirubrobacteraceae bacterium]